MTNFEILEQLANDLPPEAWKMVPEQTQKLVLDRVMESPKYDKKPDGVSYVH